MSNRTVWHNRFRHTSAGTSHAVEDGRTLCGIGISSPMWTQDEEARDASEAFVDCRRCRAALEKEKRSKP